MTKGRKLRKQWAVKGEAAGKWLSEWLNERKRSPAHQRIESLLGNLHFLMSEGARYRQTPDETDEVVYAETQRMLSRYAMAPQLVSWRHIGNKGAVMDWNPGKNHETGAVYIIRWLGEHGFLWRVRKCQHCGRWFYARFRKHRHDKTACRVAEHSKKPEVKAQRAAYMRDRRAREREQEEEFFAQHRQQSKRKRGSR